MEKKKYIQPIIKMLMTESEQLMTSISVQLSDDPTSGKAGAKGNELSSSGQWDDDEDDNEQ